MRTNENAIVFPSINDKTRRRHFKQCETRPHGSLDEAIGIDQN